MEDWRGMEWENWNGRERIGGREEDEGSGRGGKVGGLSSRVIGSLEGRMESRVLDRELRVRGIRVQSYRELKRKKVYVGVRSRRRV